MAGTRSREAEATVRRQGPSGTSARKGAGAPAAGAGPGRDRGGPSAGGGRQGRSSSVPASASGGGTLERHRRELAALVCLGLAVFLSVVLLLGGEGGVLGDVSRAALATILGRLAFIFPLALLAAAAVLVFELRPRLLSGWAAGLVLVVLALLLLVAAGFPPLGEEHGPDSFVAEDYRARAGWAGELLHEGLFRLAGGVGVALVGWLGLVAGLSLLTGLTLREAAARTGRVTRRARARVEDLAATARQPAAPPRDPLADPYRSGFGPAVPDDAWPLQGEDDPFLVSTVVGPPGPGRPVPLVDGSEEFPDLFAEAGEAEDGHATAAIARAEGVAPVQTVDGERPSISLDPREEPDATRILSAAEAAPPGESALGGAAQGELFVEEPPPYSLPSADLLHKSVAGEQEERGGDRETAALLVETLSHFGVEARVGGMVTGPRVTRYELQLAPGTKVAKVASLKDDLAYALASTEIRILAPIPGKSAVGVEVPNRRPSFVTLGDIYRDFPKTAGPLMVWLGKDISGKPVYTDLAKLPHLLIAGTTGSGKSGCVNCIVSSILLRARPDQVRMIMIDPKKVELSPYERIPHLLVPVVTNMKNAAGVLANVVKEMDNRYELMELEHARHLDEMNKSRRRRGEVELPYVVVVVDELADLMMVAPSEVEEYIIRLAQKARAVGIHLVVATQRPSVDVITGMIKANIPSRIAFAVSSQTDSRVILDQNGAEALLGMGDMLFKPLGSHRLQRIQGAYITEEEIELLVTHARLQGEPEFREELLRAPEREADGDEAFDPDEDDLLAEAAELVLDTGSASVSMLQRRLRVGYTRAGRLIDMLERRGIVGPYEGSKSRQILVRPEERERVLEGLRRDEGHALSVLDEDESELL
jgi:DNA segregation ATPase FtsK/SpoIIIE, S-DNA-T family